MKNLYFVICSLLLVSCGGLGETCSLEDFDGFETEKLDTLEYRFLEKTIVNSLKPAITYKFKDKPSVSFTQGKDFTLLKFSVITKDEQKINHTKIRLEESEIKFRKCYAKCGYLGQILKFRAEKANGQSCPVLKIMTAGLKRKIVNANSIYFEGKIENMGLYVGNYEFVFLPHDNSLVYNEEFNMKALVIQENLEWIVYIFYSKKNIKTDVFKAFHGVA